MSDASARVHAVDRYPRSWPSDPARWPTPRGLARAWVADVDSRIAGHVVAGAIDEDADGHLARGRPASAWLEIKRLFVDPGARGHGIGKLLLGPGSAMQHDRRLTGGIARDFPVDTVAVADVEHPHGMRFDRRLSLRHRPLI